MIRPIARAMLLIAGLIPALSAGAAPPYDPDAPVPTPLYAAPPSAASVEAAMGDEDWRAAHEAVSEFRRGHVDILRWEAAHTAAAAAHATAPTDGPLLSPADAVRMALGNRPDLFATTDMSALVRAQADIAAVELARDVHRAWIDAVVAAQRLRHLQDVFDTTEAGAELALRMTRSGNWSRERSMRELLALSEAGIALAQARQGAVGAREQLIRLVGLWGEATRFTLPERLPALPSTPMSERGLEATALRNHPHLSVAAIEAERSRRGVAPRLLETWSEITTAALSRMKLPAPDADNPLGPLITSAPVLNLDRTPGGHEALAAARAYAGAAELAAIVRSRVREAYHQYRVAYDIARTTDHDVVRLNGLC
ncbi:MAG TPA: TolC family protein [Rhodocyclaceae bacterium]|nr:TolC family protein [Rhodocyclaceae bacterium]